MGCLLAIVGYLFPRLTIIALAVFTTFLSRAYETWIWPVLGFFFLPVTTLAYAAGVNWFPTAGGQGLSGATIVMVVIAVLVDLGLVGWRGGRGSHMRNGRGKFVGG